MSPARRARPLARAAAVVAAAAWLAAGAGACSWSVPADPGLHTRLRSRARATGNGAEDASTARATHAGGSDPAARSLYLSRCGRCHEPYAPRHVAPEEWPAILRRMGPRAGVFGAERERLLSWLRDDAR